MNNQAFLKRFPAFWLFISRYDEDFNLDYKNEVEYWGEFIKEYSSKSNEAIVNDLLIIMNVNEQEATDYWRQYTKNNKKGITDYLIEEINTIVNFNEDESSIFFNEYTSHYLGPYMNSVADFFVWLNKVIEFMKAHI